MNNESFKDVIYDKILKYRKWCKWSWLGELYKTVKESEIVRLCMILSK